ncbi:MAG: hypothetical protein ABIN74_14665, partial [Ferruginibacter sp.]
MRYTLLTIFVFLQLNLFAQSAETSLLFKKFIHVCNAYKQLPLQLTIEYKKLSNIPLDGTDSTLMEGVFYMDKDAAYINFSGAEQIITDSFALVVMKGINQMMLSENNASIAIQVNRMINMPVMDSSIENFSKKYTILQKKSDKETGVLEITGRKNLNSTDITTETVTLIYDIRTNNPKKIVTVKRSLLKKPADGNLPFTATTVSVPQKGDYLIKEDVTEYVYKIITHDENKKM